MWRKELTLLLLTASAVLILGQETVFLDKTRIQQTVSILSGSSLTLICRLNTTAFDRYRVNFSFDSGPANNHSTSKHFPGKFFIRHENTPQDEDDALKHTLSNVTAEDSGWYFCSIKVEVPTVKSVTSERTKIIVAKNNESTTHQQPSVGPSAKVTEPSPTPEPLQVDWWMWMLFAIAAVILIVLLIICIVLRRKYRRHREADPIYANTRPKQPSPRPGAPVNTLKKASSSQNVQHQNRTRRYEDGKRRHTP